MDTQNTLCIHPLYTWIHVFVIWHIYFLQFQSPGDKFLKFTAAAFLYHIEKNRHTFEIAPLFLILRYLKD